ncbi:RidA family protein [Sphingobium subterraneum]|uniref:Enamine deaminase RidA (YjgF/YER057c/UK114 family) n=1 Tax=Sphingobium subterraneum TaxID=627688 RepID=A0A841J9V7_9SPHN|nr:RidA family protein [Sphingobium subterraneum]MBB6125285.1 enamine deaminase RidA (YjgF/YER057c/UK114 family) [Sphingobium subterraneum]
MNDTTIGTRRLHISVSPMVKKALAGFKISRAVRAGDWLLTNGQMDMGDGGKVLNPDDLMAQTVTCMRSVYEVFAKADCSLAELAQLQIFYLAGSVDDEAAYRQRILDEFPECSDVLMIMTPVPSFATVGSEVEIDAIGVKGTRAVANDAAGVVKAVRRGDWVFASDRVTAGVGGLVAGLQSTLSELGCGLPDICRLYVYYPEDLSREECVRTERELAHVFADAPPAFHATLLPADAMRTSSVELEVIAHRNGEQQKRGYGRIEPGTIGLDWPFARALCCAEVIFASGQFPLDEAGAIAHRGKIADQARTVMARLEDALHEAGASMADLAKIKTYYVGAWDKDNWFDNLRARMERLSDPGPASSGIEGLPPVREGALLSVDGIAVLDGTTGA